MSKLPLALEHALLGFLYERPMYAYEMHQVLTQAQALGLVWRLKQSQLYALLSRLEDAGYVASETEPQGTRPPRKVMHLTASGRAVFEHWRVSPVLHGRDFRQEFLAKLYFAGQDDPAAVAALIAGQRNECRAWLADLHARTGAVDSERPFDQLVLQFRAGQIAAILDWLDTCAATLAVAAAA